MSSKVGDFGGIFIPLESWPFFFSKTIGKYGGFSWDLSNQNGELNGMYPLGMNKMNYMVNQNFEWEK